VLTDLHQKPGQLRICHRRWRRPSQGCTGPAPDHRR
jgi:hypothetical protein